MKLNLGCGNQIPDGWTNVDYSLGARLSKIPLFKFINRYLKLFNMDWDKRIYLHNLTKPFPWLDNNIDVVYSSHTLEHMDKQQGREFLQQCHRVLKPGGLIRIIVPDLRHTIDMYLNGELRADDLIENLDVLYPKHSGYIKNKLAPFIRFPHKCMYDTQTLVAVMNEVGFQANNRPVFESDIPDINNIELKSRTKNAVIVEGKKHHAQ